MSAVLNQLLDRIKEAMKAKDQVLLSVLRLIKSEAKNKEIELRRELTEQDFLAVVNRMVKQRRDSISQYEQGGRSDLVEKEQGEIEILQGFLPKPLTEDELGELIAQAIETTQAASPKQMGLVMKALKDQTTGRVDGKLLSEMVKNALIAKAS